MGKQQQEIIIAIIIAADEQPQALLALATIFSHNWNKR